MDPEPEPIRISRNRQPLRRTRQGHPPRTLDDGFLTAEATQLTFILLVRKAAPHLGGWLHRPALMRAKNLQRGK